MEMNSSNLKTDHTSSSRPLSAINRLTKMKKNDYPSLNYNSIGSSNLITQLNASNNHNTMINNTLFIAENSPKNRNFQNRIKSAHSNSKFTIDKEKLYDENLRLKSELNKMKSEMEVTRKENSNLEIELSKKDKLLEDLVIDTQNSLLTNLNNLNETGPLNKTILGRITETHLVTNVKKQYKELKKELKKKNEEIENLKKINKISKINELSLENKSILEEMMKLKRLYEQACFKILESEKYLKDMGELQENFNKQVYLILTLQENLKKTQADSLMKNQEINKTNKLITEKIKKIAKLKKDLKFQLEINERLLRGNKNSARGETSEEEKNKLIKKLSDLKIDYHFYKDLSEKRDRRIRDLESMLKMTKEGSSNQMEYTSGSSSKRLYKFDDNPEEKTDSTILLLKSKLSEMKTQKDLLEKSNKELQERLSILERNASLTASDNPNYLYELKNSDKDKDFDIITEDQMNELIYILIKNFEANKIDNNIIEQRIFSDLPDLKDEGFVSAFTNNILSLLRIKNERDQILILSLVKSFMIYNSPKEIEEFKAKFLSLFESIIYYNVDQKQMYNKALYRKFFKFKKFLEEAFDFYDENKRGYITFLNLRKILEKMKVKLRNELIEYLIYLLKSYTDENSSITELKYENLIKILNDENYGKPDELDLEEEENEEHAEQPKKTKQNHNGESDEENPNLQHNDTEESGIEITTEEYLKIVEGILIELTNRLYQKHLTIDELFKPFVTQIENKEKKTKVNILELKYLVNILHDELEINLDSVDIYCLFTKFKVDENETEEIIDFEKFQAEINNMIADPNAFYLKIQMEKEANNFKNFNDKNNLNNLKQKKNPKGENNFDTFVNMNNANMMTSIPLNNLNENVNNFELQMKMNSLDYLRTFLRENKIEFENLIQPLTDHFKKNSFSGDIYIDLNLFDEYLESKNLFSRTEFIENLPEIFANESIRMALLTKDNKINLSFLKQILYECGSEGNFGYNAFPVESEKITRNISNIDKIPNLKQLDNDSKQNKVSNLDKLGGDHKENKKGEKELPKEKKDYFDKYSSPKESEYSESFRQLQQELLNDNIEYVIDEKDKKESHTYRIENES